MAPPPADTKPDTKRIAEAQKLAKTNPSKAESIYKDVLSKGPGSGEAALKDYETALMGLGELYRDQKKSHELSELVTSSRSTLSSFAKAKTAKIGELVDTPYTHVCIGRAADDLQSANCSIYFLQSPTLSISRYPPRSLV